MEYIIVNVFVPIVIAIILITTIFTIIRIILDIFHISMYLVRIICFFIAYYFIGEYALGLIQKYIASDVPDFIVWIYTPIQVLLNFFNINI
jgi:hypothetical protein